MYVEDTDYNLRGQKEDWWVSGGQGLRGVSGSGLGGVKHRGEREASWSDEYAHFLHGGGGFTGWYIYIRTYQLM